MGEIILYYGPMFSGKTSSMCNCIERWSYGKNKNGDKNNCLLIKNSNDIRYTTESKLATHSGHFIGSTPGTDYSGKIDVISTSILKDIDFAKYDVIGIDEGQFFDNLVNVCVELRKSGKKVAVAGLNGDFKQEGFSQIIELIPKCTECNFLTAVCMCCGEKASYSIRKSSSSELIEVGSADKYLSVCAGCIDK